MPSTTTRYWRVRRDYVDHYPATIVDGEWDVIARIAGNHDQREANGPLLAAAPALLAAAEAALSAMEYDDDRGLRDPERHNLRAAIALARGEDS